MCVNGDPSQPIDRHRGQPEAGSGPDWSESLIEQLHARIDAPSCASPELSSAGGDSWCALLNPEWQHEVPSAATLFERPGGVCGRFVIEALIGAGSFGVVYRARDKVLERHVALKLPRPALLLSHAARQLFEREAKLVAKLDHRGIVPLFEFDEDGPVWFLVSAFCEGPSLATWLQQQGSLIAPRIAARLVIEVADAVHHAHHRGVIHRDLKPSNILLELPTSSRPDDLPRPRVTDFGLAIPLSNDPSDAFTQGRAGTMSYMAPEIKNDRGVSSVSSDIYAMGVVLFQLLTGKLPEATSKNEEVPADAVGTRNNVSKRSILRDPNISELRLQRADVGSDLEAIVAKCLAEQPEGRYGSAAELAADLGRYLDGYCVQARPVGPLRRAANLCRRKPALATLSLCLFVTLTALFIHLARSLHREQSLRILAERRTDTARRAVDMMYTKVAEEWLPAEPRAEKSRRDLLLDAESVYAELAREQPHEPELQHKLSDALHRSATVHAQYRELPLAIEKRRRGLAILDALVAKYPSNRNYRFDRFYNLLVLSDVLANHKDARENEASERAFADACREITELLELEPHEPKYLDAAAAIGEKWGVRLSAEGKLREAKAVCQRSADIASELYHRFPDHPLYEKHIAGNLRCLANWSAGEGNLELAIEQFETCADIYSRLAPQFPEYPELRMHEASCRFERAALMRQQGLHKEAERLGNDALDSLERLAADYTEHHDINLTYVKMLCTIGEWRFKEGSAAKAEAYYRRAISQLERILASSPESEKFRGILALILRTCPIEHLLDTNRADKLDKE
jgi:serine/threonine protein kinase